MQMFFQFDAQFSLIWSHPVWCVVCNRCKGINEFIMTLALQLFGKVLERVMECRNSTNNLHDDLHVAVIQTLSNFTESLSTESDRGE